MRKRKNLSLNDLHIFSSQCFATIAILFVFDFEGTAHERTISSKYLKIQLDTNLKIIFLNQNNYVGRSS